ncbi:MAG TPA: glycosyltransferase [Candidatus Eisenbergiella merdavium]|uniref:Glycosyltransferase n=1 Tax=Candidatus Eisenbergiella merdavium TaxID=2838551 RepID=A0A9D2SQ26_9FIRM|nr:glycosyltransferase [Candidatus Eisenbergiella merdavium]
MKPEISVVMTACNTGKYIRDAVESILSQSNPDFELIVVNDGSTDNTDEIMNGIRDERIRYIRSAENRGIAFSRNLGTQQARGKYLAVMDSDDIAPPYRLRDQYDYMESHPEVGVLSGDAFNFGTENRYRTAIQGNERIQYRFFFRCPINNPAAMVRMDLLERTQVKYDVRYRVCSDYKFWIDLLNRTKFANLGGKPYVFYRTGHSESITTETSRLESVRERNRVVKEISYGFLDRFGLSLSKEEYDAVFLFRSYGEKHPDRRDYEKMAACLEKLIEQGRSVMARSDLWEEEMRFWLAKWEKLVR